MSEYYTGIGSRKTPPLVKQLMIQIARYHQKIGMVLRSGHAPGADQAFERGAGSLCEIFLPWRSFESQREIEGEAFYDPTEQAIKMASKFHPAWRGLSPTAKKFHARNCHQVLGYDLETPSKYIICWTKNAQLVGGTAQALRIAQHYEIPIYNLGKERTFHSWIRAVNN